MRTNKTKI